LNRLVNSIAGRMSLRPPQHRSLEILDRVTEIVPPRKEHDAQAALATIHSEFPSVTDFERDFPSLCFALATGVGKTRLMGAFISYLHLAHGINNFFVMAPNLTIYNKLITDFRPNTPKYVFTGIGEFATAPPAIITGDNYESSAITLFDQFIRCKINIFNISKINSEVRGGKAPRIKRLSEYIGESYFDYLAGLKDLVLIMDESHRYRASAGVRGINELKPILGLELTATPLAETAKGSVQFKNVIYDYPLSKAMQDGFVKEPAVVTQKNFDPAQFTPAQIQEIKLQDGVRLHESTKVELETYARQTGQRIVKPFMLIIARDTAHASELMGLIQSEKVFDGRYKDKVIQVDSSRTGAEEEEMVQRLLAVESPEEPTEIVIHVNMLKEGWDVTNLYTIVPLRAANARILIEQSVGRGLRLPYGKRTGVAAVDRLNIIAHDRFQEIIDEANRPDSVIRVRQVILDPNRDLQKTETVISQSRVDSDIAAIANPVERAVAEVTRDTINRFEWLPSSGDILKPDIQQQIVKQVETALTPSQLQLAGITEKPDIAAIVRQTSSLVVQQTIDIPRIQVVPTGDVTTGYDPFKLDTSVINYQPVSHDLYIQYLRDHRQESLSFGDNPQSELRLEDHVVRGLMDFDDVSYDDHADLLYDLAAQLVAHLRSYLSEDDARNVLIYHQRQIAGFVHAQMQEHQWEKAGGYTAIVSKGFTQLKGSAFTKNTDEPIYDFQQTVEDKSRIAQMVFGGFQRCLNTVQKFQSDTERKLAIILDRESQKWFKPASGQIRIFYKDGTDQSEYVPDFVAETGDRKYLLEAKASNAMNDADVQAKKQAAATWCRNATQHATENDGKPWTYLLIPHDAITENMTLRGLAGTFTVSI